MGVGPGVAIPQERPGRPWSVDLRSFVRGSIPLLLSLGLLNASNYAFHIVASRLLGPSEYGALAGVLAFVLVLSVPCGVLQTLVAKRLAGAAQGSSDGNIDGLIAGLTKAVGAVALAVSAALVAASPAIAAVLRVEPVIALLLAPYALLALVGSVPLGALQGRMRFGAVAWTQVIGVLVRLVCGLGLILLGLGVVGALLGTVLATATMVGVAIAMNGIARPMWRSASLTMDGVRGKVATTLAALASFWLLVEADLLLARQYLPSAASGIYSSAGVLARAILFLPGAVSIVALPHFARARERPAEAGRWLTVSLWLTGALSAGALVVMTVVPTELLSFTFGPRFVAGAPLLPVLGLAMVAFALVSVLVFFHIALDTKAHRLVVAAIAVEIAVVVVFLHESGLQIAAVAVATSWVVAGALYHAARAAVRWRPQAAGDGATQAGETRRDPTDPELSIVLPCHNAGPGLSRLLERLSVSGDGTAREIIVVSDGSTDGTAAVARSNGSASVRVIEYPERAGKGQALRVGLGEARGRYVAFMDGDGDIDAASLAPLVGIMRLYEPDIVLGSKRHPLSDVRYPPVRRALSWTYHKLTRLLFRVNVRDTQTGLKLIRRDVLRAVLPRMLEKRFAFDLELLVVARQLGYTRVFEAPVRIDHRFSSTVDLSAAYHILLDTMAIFYRRYVLDTYGQGPTTRGAHTRARADAAEHLRMLILNWRDIRNPDAGGAEVVTQEVAKRWVAQGHEVSVLTSRFPGAPRSEVVDGVRIRRMGRLRSGTFHLRVQWELAHLDGRYDVVIDEINTIPFFTPLWRHRLPPIVGLIHQLAVDVWDAELPGPIAAVGRRLEPRMLGLYRDVPMVTVSESTKRDLMELGITSVTVVPQGRDEPPDVSDVPKAEVPTFLFVGRLTPNKRPDHAVEAFRSIRRTLPDARLWIVGRGPMERSLRESLPPGAEMLGFLPREELYGRMAAAHALLVTSVREGWGMVITEANGVGTPAVAYDVPGVRDAIEDRRTGVLVPAGDPTALAHACATLLADPARYAELRLECLRWATGFGWDRTANATAAAVLSGSGGPDASVELTAARSVG